MLNTMENEEEIRAQAKKIIDDFVSALEKVKVKKKKSDEGVGGFREEGNGTPTDSDFRKRMFENAPNKDDDYIIAEKKKW